jgi:hypothetical protein
MRNVFHMLFILFCFGFGRFVVLGDLAYAQGPPGGVGGRPLTCGRVECPLPGPCQVPESETCVRGGGPPGAGPRQRRRGHV